VKLLASLAILCLGCFQLSTPARAYASTLPLDTDKQVNFYGMDDSGHVVFHIFNSFRCGNTLAGDCYETVTNNSFINLSDTAPTFDWDYTASGAGGCGAPARCTISDNGWTAVIAELPIAGQGLYGYYGSNPPQLLYTEGFAGIFAINGKGDIVFDNGIFDLWLETSVPTATTPEPGSIVLLATGILAFATFLCHRPVF
jgi:hypothetical protein